MQPERDVAAATPPGDGGHAEAVQAAVEQFIAARAGGSGPDPAAFAAQFPAALQPQILAQCRQFLAFDGLLGAQRWPDATPATAGGGSGGRPFGDFVIEEELGRGGMGIVYLAHQKSLNRRVALKVMASGLTLSKRHVERFRREATAAAQLRHPAIVGVHTLTEVDGTFALAMDYVAGRNLGDLLDDLRLANGDGATTVEGSLGIAKEKGYVAECAMFCAQLASALAAAHQANVVHRDLKPRNLMLDDRRQVRLLDFGLAKSLDEGSISLSGEITGTPHYMSPEQTLAKRVEVDHRADIWALGVILYEMLTLRRPFDGKNLQQVVYQICFQEPANPQRWNHKVPRDLVTVCLKALEKDPQKRYQSAAEFEADLLRFLRWEPVQARPATAWSRAAKWARRHRLETTLGATLAAAGLVALGIGWSHGRQADELLAQAAVASREQRFGDAKRLADAALALRNDETARALLTSYSAEEKRIAHEATLLALKSKERIDRNREEAIAIALEAEQLHSSVATRSAVLEALGSGSVARTLRWPGDGRAPSWWSAAWSPDGALAATVGYAGRVAVWDAATAEPRTVLTGHATDQVVIAACWCGPERLLTVGNDRTLRSWRLPEGAPEHTVSLPGLVFAMRADRGGHRVLLATYGKGQGPYLAQVYDTATATPCSDPVAHPDAIVRLALAPDGTLAATATDAAVRLWRVADGKPVGPEVVAQHGHVRGLAFTPDGTLLAVAGDDEVQFVRSSDGRTLGRVRHSQPVTCLAFDGSGQRLVSGSRDRTARVWSLHADGPDILTAREVATLTGHRGAVDHVAFGADDQLVLTATGDKAGELLVFDVGVGRDSGATLLHRYEAGPSILAAEFAPDGRSVLALAGQQRALVWDFNRTRGVVTMRTAGWAGAVAAAPRGDFVVTGGSDETVRAWSASDGVLRWTSRDLRRPQTRLDIDAAGERIASSGPRDDTVHVLRLADGELLYELPGHGGGIAAVRFQRDGTRLLAAGHRDAPDQGRDEGFAVLWNTNDHTRRVTLARPNGIVAADLASDGSCLATVERGETMVRLWSLPEATAAGTLAGHGDAVTSVRFLADGQTLLTASADGSVRVFGRDGSLRQQLRAAQPLKFAVPSPDGAFVLTAGDRAEAETSLWRRADGIELLQFGGHRGPLEAATFLPDRGAVATTAKDGAVFVWPTDPVAAARRLVPAATRSAPSTTR